MNKISRVRRCAVLAENVAGRDYVVGDLHGHRSLLEDELDRLHFDPAVDRVFSVGDLVDRGPESLDTLSLIDEAWFHAVLGNHELMLLNYLHRYESRVHSGRDYLTGGGEWIGRAMAVSKTRKRVSRLADRIGELPLSIRVTGAMPFNVTHGRLPPLSEASNDAGDDRMIAVAKADHITSSRSKVNEALVADLSDLLFAERPVRISATPLADIPVTYAGHSPLRDVTVHDSYVYIDQGVGSHAKRFGGSPITVLDPREFAYWLVGVATARGCAIPEAFQPKWPELGPVAFAAA